MLGLDCQEGACVADGGLEFAAMADQPGVLHEGVDFLRIEARDFLGVEPCKGFAVVLALTQDRQPREAGLRTFEDELFEVQSIIVHRHAPFFVMVGDVQRVIAAPKATRLGLRHGQPLADSPRSQVTQPAGNPRAKAPRTIFSW